MHAPSSLRVDVATGGVRLAAVDAAVPGVLPVAVTRLYDSQRAEDGAFGPAWSVALDAALVVTPEAIRCAGGPFDGAAFAAVGVGRAARQDETGLTLEHLADAYIVSASPRRQLVFLTRHAAGGRVPLAAVRDGTGQALRVERRGGRLAEVRTPDGHRVAFEQGSAGVEALVVDGAVVARYAYAGGALRSVTAAGRAEHFATDGGFVVQHRRASGADAFVRYDSHGRGIALWTTGDAGIRVAYDDARQTTRVLDAAGGQTLYRHALGERVLERISADGRRRAYYYGASGQRIGYGEPDHVRRLQPFDEARLAVLDGADRVAFVDYDAHGRAHSASGALEPASVLTSDDEHALVGVALPGGGVWAFARDAAGRVTRATSPEGRHAFLVWSEAGLALHDADGMRWQHARTGTTETHADRSGRRLTRCFLPDGRLVDVRTSGGYAAEFLYDADGRLAAASDSERVQMRLDRDAGGRVVRMSAPGRTVTVDRDPLGRAVAAHDGPTNLQIGYDGDRLARVTRDGVTATYAEHDGQTVVTDPTGTRRYGASGDVLEHTTSEGRDAFTYGPSGELRVAECRDGSSLVLTYDADGRLEAVGGSTAREGALDLRLAYDLDGLLRAVRVASVEVVLTRDALGRLSEVRSGHTSAHLAYDGADRLVRLSTDATTVEIDYDDLDRPVAVRRDGQESDLRTLPGVWSETFWHSATTGESERPMGEPSLSLTVARHGAALAVRACGLDLVLWAYSEARVPRVALGLRRVAALVRGVEAALPVPTHTPAAWLAAWTPDGEIRSDHTALPRSADLGDAWEALDTGLLDAALLDAVPTDVGAAPQDDPAADSTPFVTGSHCRGTFRSGVWRTRAVRVLLGGPDLLAPDGAPHLRDLLHALGS